MTRKQEKEKQRSERRKELRILRNKAKSQTHAKPKARGLNYAPSTKDSKVRSCIADAMKHTPGIKTDSACENCARGYWCDPEAYVGSEYCQALRRCRVPITRRAEAALSRMNKEEYK